MRDRRIALLLLLCLFAQTMLHARAASITFDEGPHLAIGYATLRTGDFRLQPVHIHPPLANIIAAAPLLLQDDLPDPHTIPGWEIASLSAVTDAVVWRYPHPRRLALSARSPIALLAVLLGAVIFRWASDLLDERAAPAALFFYAFDPNIIAHGSLVTTDLAVVLGSTGTLFLLARYLRLGRRRYLALAGLTLGLTLGSKVSAVSLLPVTGLLCLLGPRGVPMHRRPARAAFCVTLGGMTLWAIYGFEVRPLPGLPFPLPAATHLAIFRALREHYRLGHPAFLWGQVRAHGWWYYFPVAFALKTPLPTLLQTLSGQGRANRAEWREWRWAPTMLFPALYAAATLFSSVNIGYRHLLPLLPFLHLLAGRGYEARRSKWQFTRYLIPIWLLIATLHTAPDYLAFFNLLAGGPDGGYRYLVDSNLDWGQNLWQLHAWMHTHRISQIYYAHFSPARPQVYSIRAALLPPDPRAVDFAPLDPAPGVYVIGATVLQGVYTPDVNTYAWFRSREPLDRLGHALFIYRVPDRPAVRWLVRCDATTLPTHPFRSPAPRTVRADCRTAWVYPALPGPGVYLLPPDVPPPPGVTPEARLRSADGRQRAALYRLDGPSPAPSHTLPTTLDGPLTFLGYTLSSPAAVHPGDTPTIRLWWRVKAVPSRPLSLMAHLIGPDGSLIAVGDALGFPIEQWRPGDIFAQRHILPLPEDAPPGEYTVIGGGYWLDTGERWPGDAGRLPVTPVTVTGR